MQILFYLKMKKKNLIFDIGRGIFDISTSKIKNNEYYVLSSYGENYLSGEDFNQRLEDYIIKEIKKKINLKILIIIKEKIIKY